MESFAEMLNRLLKNIFPTRVTFDDGSYIEFFNREAILYAQKDGHKMEVVWYFQSGRIKGRSLHISDINKWDTPHEMEQLSHEKIIEIQQKIVMYCQKRNISLEIKE